VSLTAFNPYSTAGVIDPFVWTEARNFGAESGCRPHTQYRSYADDAIEWQKSVYDLALDAHQLEAFDFVIDLGCGAGTKSARRFSGDVKLLQVDRKDFRAADVRASGVHFLSASFESWDDLDRVFSQIDVSRRTLIICADVIEHLHDPRPLLTFLRRVLVESQANIAFVSTPDHERIDGARRGELPSNLEHVRQWSVFTFGMHLRSAGFAIRRYGLVSMNEFDKLGCTICAELVCNPNDYNSFLEEAGLPESSTRLLVTGEHKSLGRGGGIGTYAYQSDLALDLPSITLLFGENGASVDGVKGITLRRLVHVGKAVRPVGVEPQFAIVANTASALLDAAKTLVFFFPEIKIIEFDDYTGFAHAIAQAKETSVLPSGIKTICYCHGNHHYLEVNHGRFFFSHEHHVRERVCIEHSDVALIPSDYLSRLYKRAGLKPKEELRLAYPYTFELGAQSIHDYKKVRRIVFFGKRTRGKGFHLFGEAINALAEANELRHIDEIIVAGVGADEFAFADAIANKVRMHLYSADRVVKEMHAERVDTLAVIPYLGDNFPYSVHELLDAGVQTIFARAGGLPEVISGCDPEDTSLFDVNPAALAACIREKIGQSGMVRGAEVQTLRWRFVQLQNTRNEAYRKFYAGILSEISQFSGAALPRLSYDVVITFHNEPGRYLKDALDSLNSQSILASKIVIVNDCSKQERIEEAEKVAKEFQGLNIEFVTPRQNLGLADARNYGVSFTSAEFVIAHDVDNMLRSDAAEKMLATMASHSNVAAVTSYNLMFPDHESWIIREETTTRYGRYEPIGPDLGEFEKNYFGDALAMYRRSVLAGIGGWRNTGREPLEDFELFYTLVAEGHALAVVPAPILLYRVRSDSMLRTYDRFSGYLRLADVVTKRLGSDGLSIVRHCLQARYSPFPAQISQDLPSAAAFDQTARLLVAAALPPRLRDEATLVDQAIQGPTWKVVALRHPLKIRYWQTLRRLQRAAQRLGLRL
jgi:GT2 family glycosyltransferase/SAM-dependent methyltransferase/glycosyltransferase involved in cell wall biosynthesis